MIKKIIKKILKRLRRVFERFSDKQALKARRRFLAKMNAKCDELGIPDYIIESSAGVGLGGEVENEQLGRGYCKIPVKGVIKIMVSALSYDFLMQMWKHKDYVIKTKENQDIFLKGTLDKPGHGTQEINEKYEIIAWKTGQSIRAHVSNLVCAVKSDELNGKVLVGVVSCSVVDTMEHNRGKAMRALLDT